MRRHNCVLMATTCKTLLPSTQRGWSRSYRVLVISGRILYPMRPLGFFGTPNALPLHSKNCRTSRWAQYNRKQPAVESPWHLRAIVVITKWYHRKRRGCATPSHKRSQCAPTAFTETLLEHQGTAFVSSLLKVFYLLDWGLTSF